MAGGLVVLDFTAELLSYVREFDCGSEPFEQELAGWIREHALQEIKHTKGKTQVWLYFTAAKELVGYGSLGTTRWPYPDAGSGRLTLAIIPNVAIQKIFQGKPDGPPQNRYSTLMVEHLVSEAIALPKDQPLIGLFVHPDNQRAIKFYERMNFTSFHKAYTDPITKVTYLSMIRRLPDGPNDAQTNP